MRSIGDQAIAELRDRLARRTAVAIEMPEHRRASVIAPLVRGDHGWSLLFCLRAASLSAHGGQISFPGGALEADESHEDAARRETEEEVGVPGGSIELIGRLDDLVTISGFVASPFVGIIPERFDYVLQEREVARVFEVPLQALLADDQPHVRYVAYQGRSYPTYSYVYGDIDIWGLTARMVKQLTDVLRLSS
ncbi:MAG TPA: CoA pyrophosphatase [Thermoanaerobaculia bacterium]|nr:CoA pyrophosphatase [Thermoanaerobaculia bacterium]